MANKKPSEDNLDKDLLEIIEASFKFGNKRFTKLPADKNKKPGEWQALHQQILTDELMTRLSLYVVRRDHLVKDAGIELGRKPINRDVFIANCAGFLEDHFPKGKTKMRGEAMVLVSDITRLLMDQKIVKEAK